MKRTDYETLAMEEIIVEMENGFLVGSAEVENYKEEKYGIENQTINTAFDADKGFTSGGWN